MLQNALPPENKVGELRQDERIPTPIHAGDTQTDVLRRAYTEYGKRAGLADPEAFAAAQIRNGDVILHPQSGRAYTAQEFEAQRASGSIVMLPTAADLTALRQTRIGELLSVGLTDWFVTRDEQRQAVELLRSDPNLSATIGGLNQQGKTEDLLRAISDTAPRRELIDLLGRNLNQATAHAIAPHVERLDVNSNPFGSSVNENLWQVRFNLARLGVTTSNTVFDRATFADLISADAYAPFTGVGASGLNPK